MGGCVLDVVRFLNFLSFLEELLWCILDGPIDLEWIDEVGGSCSWWLGFSNQLGRIVLCF